MNSDVIKGKILWILSFVYSVYVIALIHDGTLFSFTDNASTICSFDPQNPLTPFIMWKLTWLLLIHGTHLGRGMLLLPEALHWQLAIFYVQVLSPWTITQFQPWIMLLTLFLSSQTGFLSDSKILTNSQSAISLSYQKRHASKWSNPP